MHQQIYSAINSEEGILRKNQSEKFKITSWPSFRFNLAAEENYSEERDWEDLIGAYFDFCFIRKKTQNFAIHSFGVAVGLVCDPVDSAFTDSNNLQFRGLLAEQAEESSVASTEAS